MPLKVKISRSIIVAILIIVISKIVFGMLSKAAKKPPIKSSFRTINVLSATAQNKSEHLVVNLSGKLVAKNRIDIFSEVNGLLQSPNFREGNRFSQGQILASINDSEMQASIKSQKSILLNSIAQLLPDLAIDFPNDLATWQKFHASISFDKKLPALPEINDEKLNIFVSGKNVFTNYYNIKSLEERLAKYKIYAPFSGILSQADIDPGTLVRAGQKLGTFIQPNTFELEASIGVDDLKFIKVGNKVELKSSELGKTWQGSILRINESLDAATQSIKVYIGVTDSELKEGQYLTAQVNGSMLNNVVEIPRKYLIENDHLYFIENDSVLTKKKVSIQYLSNESAYLSGVENGTVYLNQTITGGYDGMIVKQIAEKQ
ncbi:MAG: HlyD family efflux transporter periplasmic adaptor subunit [Flavobacteriales bacterium]|nr:HlyD family efflux transporter periplasmic adaptor subunit [Flavobacteriales bacterium]